MTRSGIAASLRPPPARIATAWRLAAIIALSAFLNLWNLDFPLGFHADEPHKIASLRTGIQTFRHPLLMLQVVRVGTVLVPTASDQELVVLGRGLMALCGVGTVVLSYLLAQRRLSALAATGVALAVAVSPTLVIHAHYLKEDTILTTCLLAAVLCFLRFVERRTAGVVLGLGVTTGLALASHYKALLLVPLFLFAPLLGRVRKPATFYLHLAGAGLVAGVVFLVVNWPLVSDVKGFIEGVMFEARHAVDGHDVRIGWQDYALGFHLLKSLAPGMGWPALALGLGGIVWTLASWRQAEFQDRWLVAYVLVLYLVPEVSPLKPWPDYSRYMIPIVPILLYFAWQAVTRMQEAVRSRPAAAAIAVGALAAVVAYPLYVSGHLTHGLANDTRSQAAAWLERNPGRAVFDWYARASSGSDVQSLATLDPVALRLQGVDYAVASSFHYDRYLQGSKLPNKDPEVQASLARYEEFFARPYVGIAPRYRSFAFSNPVIRIVDLRDTKAPPR